MDAPFRIDYARDGGLLRARVTGTNGSFDTTVAFWTEIAAEVRRQQDVHSLLVVDEMLDEPPPPADVFLAGDICYEKPLAERVMAWLRQARVAGAEVLIPGEAPLCVLLATHGVSSVDGVPVLDSLSCWIKQAEMLVDLKRQSGVQRCQKGYFNEPPAAERLREILAFYQLDKLA